jgi:hypothetical protein
LDKKAGCVSLIKEWVDNEYAQGRQTIISDEELEALVNKYAPEIHIKKV